MNRPTRVFLVLLQLAIGWHLFYEGAWKFRNDSWSSKGHLRNATGPFGLAMRWSAGDPDVRRQGLSFTVIDRSAELLARYTPLPFEGDRTPPSNQFHKYMPPALDQEWQDYFDRFLENYKLAKAEPLAEEAAAKSGDGAESADPQTPAVQRLLAETRFINQKNETVKWLIEGTKKVKRPGLSGPGSEIPVKISDRVQEYRNKLEEVQEIEAREVASLGPKLATHLRKARDEAASLHRSLQDDLDEQTAQMKQKLREILSYEQKRMELPAEPARAAAEWKHLVRLDEAVRWALVVLGGCLILGLLTRTACLGSSLLLFAFYLAMPPWPGLPENPMAKGHYFIINENIIEIVALLAIAMSQPGQRYGLDAWLGLLFSCCCGGRRASAAHGTPAFGTRADGMPAPASHGGVAVPSSALSPSPKG